MGARPSSYKSEPVPVKPTREWSSQQQTIFAWFEDYRPAAGDLDTHEERPQNLVVTARAGSGKTTTIIEGVNRAPEESILLCAFNKEIANELARRLENPHAEARTLHSLGMRMIGRQWRRIPISEKSNRAVYLTTEVLKQTERDRGEKTPYVISRLITNLHTKAREIIPLTYDQYDLMVNLAFRFDLVPDERWGDYDLDFVVSHAMAACHHAATEPPTYDVGVDYADMIFLPLVWQLTSRDYDLVVVDEAQDQTGAQLELVQRCVAPGGRICVVGDDRQCQPAGTMVRSSVDGNVPIESLKVGDTIEAFDRHGQVFIEAGRVNQIASRHYTGELIHVTAMGRVSRCTPNHKWLVRWANKHKPTWITYLMQQGRRFRVGQCQLFRHNSQMFGLSERARVERADFVWILATHESLEHALAYEQILNARYGLPEMVFYPPCGIKYFTQTVINYVYQSLEADGLWDKAIHCLVDHGRDINYPIYTRSAYARRGRTTLFETQACNLLSEFMSIAVVPNKISGHDKKDRHQVLWAPISVSREDFDGLVYSLDVDRYHKYVADGLVTCNSIYGFRGADTEALGRLQKELNALTLPLTVTYRCGQEIVREAQKLVPDIETGPTNPAGTVMRDIGIDTAVDLATPGDFILSRLNAPLVKIVFKLWRKGVRAKIRGRDLGDRVVKTLEKAKVIRTDDIAEAMAKVNRWHSRQRTNYIASGCLDLVARLDDDCGIVYAIGENSESTSQLLDECVRLFTDESGEPVVLCSSIHKAKGLEANRVFVLKDTLYRRGRTLEEDNAFYVAITRAKDCLVLVSDAL